MGKQRIKTMRTRICQRRLIQEAMTGAFTEAILLLLSHQSLGPQTEHQKEEQDRDQIL